MEDVWKRIEQILDERAVRSESAGERRRALRPPVRTEDVAGAEKDLGLPLTDELKASLAVHDGQDPGALEVFTTWGLHPLAKALETWRFFCEMAGDGTLDDAAWRREWLPIATNGGGDHLLHDLRSGAVLRYRRASSSRPVVATSLRAWLEDVAETLPAEEDEE